MTNQVWSWVLGAVGLVGFILAGRRVWWCWYINIAAQGLWFAYAIASQQWGFLVTAFVYTIVFTKNAAVWTSERHIISKEKNVGKHKGPGRVRSAIAAYPRANRKVTGELEQEANAPAAEVGIVPRRSSDESGIIR